MLGNWANSPSGRQLMKEIAKADSKLTFIMQLEGGNENLKIRLTKDEIKDLAEGKIDPVSPREILEINVTSTNAQCKLTNTRRCHLLLSKVIILFSIIA